MKTFPIAALYRSPSFLQQTHRKNHASFNYSFQWDSQPFKPDSGLYVFFWQSSWVSIFFLSMLYTYLFYWGWLWEAKQWGHNRTKNENDSQRQKIVENLLEKKNPLRNQEKLSWRLAPLLRMLAAQVYMNLNSDVQHTHKKAVHNLARF